MKTGIFSEYLGDVATELLLQNLTNPTEAMLTFPAISPIDAFRQAFPGGFIVTAQIEMPIYETHEEQRAAVEMFQSRLANARNKDERAEAMTPPGRKLVGLVLTPK